MSSYTEHNNRVERWFIRGSYLLGLLSFFGALLYFVGRRYAEQYFAFMGIPPEELSLDFAAYAYYGANPIQLIIVIVFVFLGVGIFKLVTYPKPSEVQTLRKRRKTGFIKTLKSVIDVSRSPSAIDKRLKTGFYLYIAFLIILYSFALPILTLTEIFYTQSTFLDALILTGFTLALLVLSCGLPILFFSDREAIQRICHYGTFRNLVLWGSLIVLVLLPYLGAGAYGSFKGYTDIYLRHIDKTFDTVSFEADTPINTKLGWEKVDKKDSSYYKTTRTIYLIYANKENLYIKLDDDAEETIVIPKVNLDSYTVKKRLFPTITTAPTTGNVRNRQ